MIEYYFQMTDTIPVEPDVIDNLRPTRKKKRKDKYSGLDDDSNYPDGFTDHYKSTNRWILVVFTTIIVLLVIIIIYLIYDGKKKKEKQESVTNTNENISPSMIARNRASPYRPYLPYQPYPPQQLRTSEMLDPATQQSKGHSETQLPHTSIKITDTNESSTTKATDAITKSHDDIINNHDNNELSNMVERLSSNKTQSGEDQEEMRQRLVSDILPEG